jgi:predicted RNA-binding Zn-ribbon protein involved in translation (DUF1610 family)
MEEKLNKLYNKCINELKSIGINVLDEKNIGNIEIKLSKRNNKRYGCCRQEEPDRKSRFYERIGTKKYLRYAKYNKHTIEISKWVMELDEKIIKNTIMHEIIHCFPLCNNHGEQFKKYAKYINKNLEYDISRLGNKVEDYKKSNIEINETIKVNYKIICKKCNQTVYRQRLTKNFIEKYRCGKCGGEFIVYKYDKLLTTL